MIVNYTIVKQPITYSNCGKIVRAKETCDNRKIEEPLVPFVSTNVAKPVVEVIAQLIKVKMPLRYPCIICYNSKHCAPNCPRKKKVHNVF